MIIIEKTLAQILLEHKKGTLDMNLYPDNQAIKCWADDNKGSFYYSSMKALINYLNNWKSV